MVLICKAMNSVEKHPSASRAIEYAQLGFNLPSLIIHMSPEIETPGSKWEMFLLPCT